MQIFKFGGASVKDAAGVRRVTEIIRLNISKLLVVVVSAMGKSTNALERYGMLQFLMKMLMPMH